MILLMVNTHCNNLISLTNTHTQSPNVNNLFVSLSISQNPTSRNFELNVFLLCYYFYCVAQFFQFKLMALCVVQNYRFWARNINICPKNCFIYFDDDNDILVSGSLSYVYGSCMVAITKTCYCLLFITLRVHAFLLVFNNIALGYDTKQLLLGMYLCIVLVQCTNTVRVKENNMYRVKKRNKKTETKTLSPYNHYTHT